MKIVIADDSATARMVVKRCLEIAGFYDAEFVEAGNGNEALEKVRETDPDLVFTDLTMPEMDGMEMLWAIRQEEAFKELPVVFITSANNPAKEAELLELGAYAVLAKPLNPAELAEAVRPLIPQTGGTSGW